MQLLYSISHWHWLSNQAFKEVSGNLKPTYHSLRRAVRSHKHCQVTGRLHQPQVKQCTHRAGEFSYLRTATSHCTAWSEILLPNTTQACFKQTHRPIRAHEAKTLMSTEQGSSLGELNPKLVTPKPEILQLHLSCFNPRERTQLLLHLPWPTTAGKRTLHHARRPQGLLSAQKASHISYICSFFFFFF